METPDARSDLGNASQIRQYREAVARIDTEIRETETRLSDLRKKGAWLKRQEILQRKYENARIALSGALVRQEEGEAEGRQLQMARKADQLRSDLTHLDALKNEINALQYELEQVNTEIPALESQLTELAAQQEANRLRLGRARKEQARLEDLIRKATDMDEAIAAETRASRAGAERHEALEKAQNENLHRQSEIRQALTENLDRQEEAGKWLKKHEADRHLEKDIPDIRSRLDQLTRIRRQLSEAQKRLDAALVTRQDLTEKVGQAGQAVLRLQETSARISEREQESSQSVSELLGCQSVGDLEAALDAQKQKLALFKKMLGLSKEYGREYARRKDEIRAAENILTDARAAYASLEKTFEREQTVWADLAKVAGQHALCLKYEADRQELRSGEACPLCGATDHPFVLDGLPFEGEPEQALREQDGKLKRLRQEMEKAAVRIAKAESETRIGQALQEEWAALCRESLRQLSIEDTGAIREAVKALKKTVREQNARIRAVRKGQKRAGKMHRKGLQKAEALSEKQGILNGLREDLEVHAGIAATLEKEMVPLRQEETALVKRLWSLLQRYSEDIPRPGQEIALYERLEGRQNRFLGRVGHQERLKKEADALRRDSAALPEVLRSLTAEADGLAPRLKAVREKLTTLKQAREKLPLSNDFPEKRRLAEETAETGEREVLRIEEEINRLRRRLADGTALRERISPEVRQRQVRYEALRKTLSDQAASAGFAGVEAVRASLLSPEIQEETAARQEALNRKVLQARERLEKIVGRWEAVRAENNSTDMSSEDVAAQVQALLKHQKMLETDRERLTRQARLRQSFSESL